MDSLFSLFKKEYNNTEVIEVENGFATFIFKGDMVYLEDIFVRAEHRNTGLATILADSVAEIAKQQGCTVMLGSVNLKSSNPTRSMKVLLAYGMSPTHATGDMVFFKKDI